MWHPFGEGRVNCAPPLPGSMMVMAAAVMMMVMVPMPTHLVPVVPMAPAHVMVELTRFRGRFVALAAQVSSCRLLSYSIGER